VARGHDRVARRGARAGLEGPGPRGRDSPKVRRTFGD
jgi:hypothetical protein